MKFKILPRRVTVLVYGDDNSVNYTASCQVNINGNRCTIDSLMGGDFYKMWLSGKLNLFKELNVIEICAAVKIGHLKLLKKYFKDKYNIIEEAGLFIEGTSDELVWIRITEK